MVLLLLLWASLAMAADGDKFVFLSSTIGPIDSGIVGTLEDQFEKETGIRVRHVGAGTGAALKIATKGQIDLVMAHAKSLEEKFIADGFGTERILVSMGERGAVMLDRQSGLFLPAMPIRVNGTVGAGDAMVAALAVSKARGDTPESAMRLAVACAAASVMKEGTGTPSFEEVNTLLGQLGRPAVL
jgi:sugar/nucleoside kinase (ribokinase family)